MQEARNLRLLWRVLVMMKSFRFHRCSFIKEQNPVVRTTSRRRRGLRTHVSVLRLAATGTHRVTADFVQPASSFEKGRTLYKIKKQEARLHHSVGRKKLRASRKNHRLHTPFSRPRMLHQYRKMRNIQHCRKPRNIIVIINLVLGS